MKGFKITLLLLGIGALAACSDQIFTINEEPSPSEEPTQPSKPDGAHYTILYKTSDKHTVEIQSDNQDVVSNSYDGNEGKLVLRVNYIPDDMLYLTKNLTWISIPKGIKKVGAYAFYGCDLSKGVVLPIGIGSIGEGAFERCLMDEIQIPEGVETLGIGAFYECTNLTSVTLPSSLELIEESFYGCTSLEYVTLKATVPPSLGDGSEVYRAFSTKSLKAIYVPKTSWNAYQNDTDWSKYQDYLVGKSL